MFSEKDELQIKNRGSELQTVLNRIENFKKGFPFLQIEEAASIGDGIIKLDEKALEKSCALYDKKVADGIKPLKFVPASGAASRMFKALFEALEECKKSDSPEEELINDKVVKQFIDQIENFAFYNDLKNSIQKEKVEENCKNRVDYLLNEKGLNYGSLPKGLLKFHRYKTGERTPFEEHLVEGAEYSKDNQGVVQLHFTVSPDHQPVFENLLNEIKEKYEKDLNVSFEVSFSQQKPSTDTIAVDLKNEPFRELDGRLLFRPGGHGSLIENLNDLNADVVFIKNIDNVVPDKLKQATVEYKKALAGVLLKYQEKLFIYQKELNEKHPVALDSGFLAEAANFLENSLNTKPAVNQYYTEKEELCHYLKEKYNRPLRICGMVKNEGEPGGGPFWAKNTDGTISLQVVESSQIDSESVQQQTIAKHATHFNPVDLVCALKNYKGEKYNLLEFTDPKTGFISKKSKDGRELKAQELPGLWNGAMSNWNTLFVEVPIETFNPVKTVNDLLRDQHL
ncbi:MAG: DUF4301 family protein [Prolixibacteraceae bacterium]|jgi:hypothetical protein|nr:DUF4301 family protein [Prolixibacteraceae bacterium]MBT6765828.1 DUF4301 family protein [Prolixibacteraceae bacterium]MBT7000018.1 DUF4301 family protein [Prolixibacteraceae bacterium]MBT7395494.1 DUF4301 family protein [Prolixibacteraceae bacterium]